MVTESIGLILIQIGLLYLSIHFGLVINAHTFSEEDEDAEISSEDEEPGGIR